MDILFNEIKELVNYYVNKIKEANLTPKTSSKEIDDIKLKINKLRENKNKEIQQYIDRFNNQSDFYIKYGAMVRKDLEQVYNKQEERLISELKKLENSNMNEVDMLKKEFREKLIVKKVLLDFELQKELIIYEGIKLDLSEFKYEYNDQQQIVNGLEWRNLFEKNNTILHAIDIIKQYLKYINWYLNQLNFVKEE